MKIIDIDVSEITIPLRKCFITSLRTVEVINDVIVKIYLDNGLIGYGEASPNPFVTGETKESIKATILNYIRPSIIGKEINNITGIMHSIHSSIIKNTSAKAAIDIAIYDLYSQTLNCPLYKILGGYREQIETDITISVNEVDEMVIDSLDAISRGYQILKIKLGLDVKKDFNRISEIRKSIGNDIKIRIDANQGWTVKEAIRIITKMEDMNFNIELVEQPVHYQDIQGMVTVTKHVQTPILADECIFDPIDALKVIQNRAADLINIKLMKSGGLYNAIKICTIAEIYGVECMIGCMLEGKISLAAAAHLAAAKSIITKFDLDGLNLCKTDSFKGGPLFKENVITMTNLPGLGFNNNCFL